MVSPEAAISPIREEYPELLYANNSALSLGGGMRGAPAGEEE